MQSFKNFFVEHYRDEIGFNDRQVNLDDKELEKNLEAQIDRTYEMYKSMLRSYSNNFEKIQEIVGYLYSFDKIYDDILANVKNFVGEPTPIDKNNKIAKLYYQPTRNKFANLPQIISKMC